MHPGCKDRFPQAAAPLLKRALMMGRRRQELPAPGSRSRRRKGCWVRSGRVRHAGGEAGLRRGVHALPRLDFISFDFITVRDGASFLVTLFLWTDLTGGVVRTRPTTHSATAVQASALRSSRVAKEDPLPTRRDF